MQFHYRQNEGMGVPITWDDDSFPYFYDRTTTEDEYKRAVVLECLGCCVTKIEYAKSDAIDEGVVSVLINLVQ